LRTTIRPTPPLAAGEVRRLRAGRDRLADRYPDFATAMRPSRATVTLLLPDGPHECEATAPVAAALVAVLIGRAFAYAATCEHGEPPPDASP
jgi:hypothetical protein